MSGCQDGLSFPVPSFGPHQDSVSNASVARRFQARISEKGEVRFGSRSGKALGMDSDYFLRFKAGHRVVLTEYGYAPQSFKGTYWLGEDGLLVLHLEGRQMPWPEMWLKEGAGKFRLHCVEKEEGSSQMVRFETRAELWPFAEVERE